jgi:hypothetical protein
MQSLQVTREEMNIISPPPPKSGKQDHKFRMWSCVFINSESTSNKVFQDNAVK